MSAIIDLNDLYLFAKVVKNRGHSAAARALGIPTSKLSQRVSELERQLPRRDQRDRKEDRQREKSGHRSKAEGCAVRCGARTF